MTDHKFKIEDILDFEKGKPTNKIFNNEFRADIFDSEGKEKPTIKMSVNEFRISDLYNFV